MDERLIPKYKVGQKVRVVCKVELWNEDNIGWNGEDMDRTIGNIYVVMEHNAAGYQLNTRGCLGLRWNYWYAEECLQAIIGEQLEFDFMKE